MNGLHALVIGSAARHPDRVAVAGPAGELTYADLDRRADAFAAMLAGAGVGPGDRVVVWGEKSPEVVVALQAVLRLGAAYVPAGETTPVGRLALMVRDCAATAVCAAGDRLAEVTAEVGDAVATVAVDAGLPVAGVAPVNAPVEPDDLAYILYTSGSTGTPKGVCLSHRNALAFVEWAVAELAAGPTDRFANHAPLTFDLSVLDLYAAFAVGAAVVLVPTALAYAPEQLVEFLSAYAITVWYSVPSALMFMMRAGGLLDAGPPPALRAVLFAGEPFPIAHVRRLARWAGAIRLLNLYGPTETNVCTFHEVRPADLDGDRPLPIGRACSGDRVWVERPDGGVAAAGETGELLVEGPTVMLGYWGAARQVGPYRTGDRVRMRPDGVLDFLGRDDDMVKVRGHRIELGEVEAVVAAHPAVSEAAVVVVGAGMDAQLVAYVSPAPGGRVSASSVRRHAATRLPPYMCPARVVARPELPRTRNGKVDRAALRRADAG